MAVAAIERASIRATEASWPCAGIDPSRFGKFRVVCRTQRALLAGVSPAPKQGPQKAVRITAPAAISFSMERFLISSRNIGWLAG